MCNISQHLIVRPAGLVALLALVSACTSPAPPPADPEAAFRARLGQGWALTGLGSREIPPPPPGTPADSPGKDLVPGQRPTIRFIADPPSAGGRSFCNGYGGPYVLRGDSLRIGQIMSSAVGCDSADSLETRFFRALRETRRFELDSAALILITEDGTRLTFIPIAGDSARRQGGGVSTAMWIAASPPRMIGAMSRIQDRGVIVNRVRGLHRTAIE